MRHMRDVVLARAFGARGASQARAIARSAYAGEIGKFLLSAVGFAAVFILLRPVSGAAVLAGYLAMLAIQITGSWLLLRRRPTETDRSKSFY